MRPSRIAGNIALVAYVWVTFSALMLTVLRLPMHFPRSLVHFSYGMMAPYQSYGFLHGELRAEGQRSDGSWETINLRSYYPVLFGEQNVRQYMAMYGYTTGPDTLLSRETWARRLLILERAKGHDYRALRLHWDQWPTMTGDYHENKFPASTDSALLLELNDE